jgi:protein SCO1/2
MTPRIRATIGLAFALIAALAIIAGALLSGRDAAAPVTEATITPDGFAVVEGGDYAGTLYDPPVVLQDFALPASTGATLSLRDFGDGWTLLFFGFTHCPDFCPTTLVEYRQVRRLLAEADRGEVNFVFVSVDAERDTPDVLARYLAAFDPAFVGLSADVATLERIKGDYGMYYALRKNDAPEGRPDLYPVDHTTRTFLIDPDGRLRASFAYSTPPAVIVAQLDALSNEES